LQFTAVAIRGSDGKIIGALEMLEDITERKRAEDLTRESEEKFKKTFEVSPLGITIFNLAKGEFVDCNKSFEKISGYSKEEIVRKHPFDLNLYKHPEVGENILSVLEKEGHLEKKSLELITKSGETRLLDAYFLMVEINGQPHAISNLLDLTDSERAKAAACEIESKYHELVDRLPEMVFEIDNTGHLVFCNKRTFELTGYSEQLSLFSASWHRKISNVQEKT
jgi:PAS domain S-box-containing protein